MTLGEIVAKLVKEEQKRKGWTNKQLAESAGVSTNVISRIKSNSGVSLDLAHYILEALGTPIEVWYFKEVK